jgi:hypothetical protein
VKQTSLAIVLLVLGCTLGCTRTEESDHRDIVISYAEDPRSCSNCPAFEVRFRTGGHVTFIGQRACAVPGEQQFRIPEEEFDELVRAFRDEDFFSIPRLASPPVVDGGLITVAYRDNRRIHETVHTGKPPSRLALLEARLRRAARVEDNSRPSLARYQALVRDGWDVNTVGTDRENALLAAVTAGDLSSTRFLLQHGATLSDEAARLAVGRPEAGFVTTAIEVFNAALPRRSLGPILLDAASAGVANTMLLLKAGADVNWRGADSRTALMNAIAAGSLETASLLVQRGALLEIRDNQGRTAMSHAAAGYNTGFIEILARHGANPNAVDRSGRTPLMIAADGCFEWNIAPLLAAGADPTIPGERGRTALQPMNAVIGDPKCGRTLRLVQAAARRR